MVWTSDYPEGRPGYGSKSGDGEPAAGQGKSGSSGAAGGRDFTGSKSSAAVAPKPNSSSPSDNKYGFPKSGAAASGSSGTGKSGPGNLEKSPFGSSGTKSKSDPHNKPNVNPISGGPKKSDANKKPPTKPGVFLLVCGVILPVTAIIFELSTHMCAKSFFDPLPTPAHVLLFALIPLSNLLVWVASRRNMTDLLGMLTLGTGMAMGVAILYSLMFLPLVPLSVVAILFFGFGLLSLAPLLAIPAVWKSSKYAIHLSKTNKTYFDGHQLEHIGHMIILCTVVAVELPSTLTRMHIGEAAHSAKPVAAIEWLRQWGNQEVMLRACYERSGRATDILGSLYEVKNPTSVEEARRIFYQVTGKPFNSVPLPAALRATRANQGLLSDGENEEPNVEDEFDRDPDIAGEAVSGVARGLTMTESKLSGFVDGQACYANLNWNVTFGNSSQYDREVRSKILLPPGAVITNAFLIVDGVEREATVMGRSMARRKYRAAVADKKDPLLVSTCGLDTVLLQLYPVSPQSKIGVRLQIVSPLAVPDMGLATLALPTFEERNFQVDIPTIVKLKSQQLLGSTVKELKLEDLRPGSTVEGSLTTPDLARFAAVVTVRRDSKVDHIGGSQYAYLVGENIRKTNYPRPNNLTVVIDGSNGMTPHFSSVLKELENLPADMLMKLVYVRDGKMEPVTVDAARRAIYLHEMANIACAGGQLNLAPLTTELDASLSVPNSAVLWIHAAQPIPGKLNRALDLNLRRLKKPLLYDFAVAAGPNEILSGMYACPALIRVDRGGDVQSDLHRLFETWRKSTPDAEVGGIQYVRKNLTPSDLEKGGLKPADAAIAQLAAFDEISKIQIAHGNHKCKSARQAVRIASEYHLVTSFSSAIITEPIPRPANPLSMLGPDQSKLPLLGGFHTSSVIGKIPQIAFPQQQLGQESKMAQMVELEKRPVPEYRSYNQSRRQMQYSRLSGATNGTVGGYAAGGGGGNPMIGEQFSSGPAQGDQFSSAGNEQGNVFASSATANTGTQIAQTQSSNEIAAQNFERQQREEARRTDSAAPTLNGQMFSTVPSEPQSMPAAPPAASFEPRAKGLSMDSSTSSSIHGTLMEKTKAKEVDALDYKDVPRRRAQSVVEYSGAKQEVAEKKQNADKNDRDAEFSDDEEEASDSSGDELAVNSPAEKSAEMASPVVPESDTYLLFGVGMLILGFALQSQRKVKAKKA